MGQPGKYSTWAGVVTTMWDSILPHQTQNTEEKFEELKKVHLKEVFGRDIKTAFRFMNTPDSSLSIIDTSLKIWHRGGLLREFRQPPFQKFSGKQLRQGPFAVPLLELLEERIAGLELKTRVLEDDLRALGVACTNGEDGDGDGDGDSDSGGKSGGSGGEADGSDELRQLLLSDKADSERLLHQLIEERNDFLAMPQAVDNTKDKKGLRRKVVDYFK
ncbi:hypothetical protein CVT24_010042 [Panaeolus cyanescens]|uniref:Uncharacterized protein n=1 Tax=Panaeolus cyanescens TaxID=181874 RepID=A0A409XC43_9AGAR|nr:hypothetical protein CVT24_010042 [Panaeolus cyanescens]